MNTCSKNLISYYQKKKKKKKKRNLNGVIFILDLNKLLKLAYSELVRLNFSQFLVLNSYFSDFSEKNICHL